MDIVHKAAEFAAKAHGYQLRKYTFEPYINHPIEVMNIVKSVPNTKEMLCAALLHDVFEDCNISMNVIFENFGHDITKLVWWLSDVSLKSDGNRANRKEKDRQHISKASPQAKTIKLADLISNSRSICEHDKDFAKVYIKEKELLLEVLTEGDPTLYAQAKDIVEKAKKEFGIK